MPASAVPVRTVSFHDAGKLFFPSSPLNPTSSVGASDAFTYPASAKTIMSEHIKNRVGESANRRIGETEQKTFPRFTDSPFLRFIPFLSPILRFSYSK